ncbi:MAG: histidine triad nucleotide-binding protein [Gammaproteobacteria bacterium]|nr:histidine triad nucleotide-binding protein [Gammaproteobacteria bacterium]
MSDTIFAKIISREIPAEIVFEDDLCLAFHDVSPQAPTHILVIPKTPIARLADTTDEDQALLGHLLLKTREIAENLGFGDAYRVVINNGEQAGQTVFHLHIHLLAGRPFHWPPG